MIAAPCPTPTHIVARPYCTFALRISYNKVVEMRTPLHPNGWPKAIAPPLTLLSIHLIPVHGCTQSIEKRNRFRSIDILKKRYTITYIIMIRTDQTKTKRLEPGILPNSSRLKPKRVLNLSWSFQYVIALIFKKSRF